MNILVANDDGYDAEGLKVLVKKLSEKHNVYVVAPDSNRSAVSQHITMFNDTEIKKISDRVYACSGYPSDCVAVGIQSDLFNVKFDAVVTGINHGGNLGTDIIYSGTCAAARQAVLNQVPGIAVSIAPYNWNDIQTIGFKFETLADFVCKNLETLVSMCRTEAPKTFVNVNGGPEDKYKGVKITNNLRVKEYNDKLKIIQDGDKLVSRFSPGAGGSEKSDSTDDFDVVQKGYVSVSVVYAEPVCDDSIKDVNLVI